MEKENPTFADLFRLCCGESCNILAYQNQCNSEEYRAAERECGALYHQLAQGEGDSEALVNAFDAAKNNLFAIDQDFIYRQGFIDCIYLLKWMKAF